MLDLQPYEICPACDRASEARLADQITRLLIARYRLERLVSQFAGCVALLLDDRERRYPGVFGQPERVAVALLLDADVQRIVGKTEATL